jgi:hypothetical protein
MRSDGLDMRLSLVQAPCRMYLPHLPASFDYFKDRRVDSVRLPVDQAANRLSPAGPMPR